MSLTNMFQSDRLFCRSSMTKTSQAIEQPNKCKQPSQGKEKSQASKLPTQSKSSKQKDKENVVNQSESEQETENENEITPKPRGKAKKEAPPPSRIPHAQYMRNFKTIKCVSTSYTDPVFLIKWDSQKMSKPSSTTWILRVSST